MKDPARWRDPKGGADAETRALLLGNQAPTPSSAEVDHVWSTLAPQLQVVPAPTHAPPAGPAAVVGTGALVGKITLAVVLVAAIGAGVGGMYSRDRRRNVTQLEQAQVVPTAIPSPASAPTVVEPAQPEATPPGLAPAAERAARPRSRAPWPPRSMAKSPVFIPRHRQPRPGRRRNRRPTICWKRAAAWRARGPARPRARSCARVAGNRRARNRRAGARARGVDHRGPGRQARLACGGCRACARLHADLPGEPLSRAHQGHRLREPVRIAGPATH